MKLSCIVRLNNIRVVISKSKRLPPTEQEILGLKLQREEEGNADLFEIEKEESEL